MNNTRKIHPQDRWILNSSGNIVGVQSADANSAMNVEGYDLPTINPTTGEMSGLPAALAVASAPSARYAFCIPGSQFVGSGNAKDRSSNAADAVINAAYTDAACWANDGYITTGAGTNLSLSVPQTKVQMSFATQSMVFSGVVNIAAPGADQVIVANGNSSTYPGFQLIAKANGKFGLRLNPRGVTMDVALDSTGVFCNGTDVAFTVAVDAVTRQMFVFRNGIICDTINSAWSSGGAAINYGLVLGGPIGASVTTYAAKFRGLHHLIFTGGLPINLAQIAQRLAAAPMLLLSTGEIGA